VSIFYCVLRGNISAGDIWQCGFHAESDADVFQVATLVAGAVPALWQAKFPDETSVTGVRIAEINEATGDTVAVAEEAVTGVTYSTDGSMPAEVAMCVTIRPVTGLISGRMYLPPGINSQMTIQGNMNSTYQASVADALQTFFQDDLGSAPSPLRLGIYSRKNHNFVGATSIQLGNVYDSQRRRRNKLVESRLTRSVL